MWSNVLIYCPQPTNSNFSSIELIENIWKNENLNNKFWTILWKKLLLLYGEVGIGEIPLFVEIREVTWHTYRIHPPNVSMTCFTT